MDRLDRISIWAIVILIISSLALMSLHMGEAVSDPALKQRAVSADFLPVNSEVVARAKLVKNLIESDNLEKAEVLVRELIQQYPYEGEPHMLMGDIFMRRHEPLKAMPEYKEAIDLNPDYLDKKTPLFQGKKLKIASGEALEEADKRIRENPGDEAMKKSRKMIYYLKRKIAGSCG